MPKATMPAPSAETEERIQEAVAKAEEELRATVGDAAAFRGTRARRVWDTAPPLRDEPAGLVEPAIGLRGALLAPIGAPLYHERMLLMKMHAQAEPARAAATAFFAGGSLLGSQPSAGLQTLAALERGGFVRRSVQISTSERSRATVASAPARPAMAMLLAGALQEEGAPDVQSLDGVTLVELEDVAHAETLRRAMADDPLVEYVSRVPLRYHCVQRKAPQRAASRARTAAAAPPAAELWNLKKIEWREARALRSFSDAGAIKVAVLDTGVEQTHPDLARRIKQYHHVYPNAGVSASEKDYVGHGTHVSGTIGALINNRIGINGICSCDLSVYKIFTDTPQYVPAFGYYAYFVDPVMYLQALTACLDAEVDVINLSIGGAGEPDPTEREIFAKLVARGTTVVAAMGNERQQGSPTSYPAALPGVIAVGATKIDDRIANFSNSGSHISVCAPGVGIWSTLPTYDGQNGFRAVRGADGRIVRGAALKRERDYAAWDGTSMATPHVTAAVALLLANKGRMSPAKVAAALIASVDRVAGAGKFSPDYGYGRLNLLKLLR